MLIIVIVHKISKTDTTNLLENSVLKMVDIYKNIVLNFSLVKAVFFLFNFFILAYTKRLIAWTSISLNIVIL